MRVRVRTCFSVLLFSPALFAQARLTLDEAIAGAVSANAQLQAGAARIDAAQGLRRQAGAGPNPRLFLQSENTRFSGNPPFSYARDADSFAYLGQTFETGGKRSRRVELAEEGVKRSTLELKLQRQQIVGRVSAAWWAAASSARYRDLLNEEATRFEHVVQYHRDRVREGASAEIDLLRIEVERDRLTASSVTAAREAARAAILLFREMGKTEFPAVEFPQDSPDDTRPLPVLDPDQVFERRYEMGLAREAVEQARAALRLQQANAHVDPDVFFGYKRTTGFDTILAGVQIPLPVRNKNQGGIEAAAAEIRAAESQVAITQALIRSEVELARREYSSRQEALTRTFAPMRDRAEEVYRVAEAAYREGGLDILRMLDAERTRLEARSAYVRALLELRQSAVALSIAQGIL